ncbi:MAG: glucosidase family protein [Actinomycetota bacterium]
MVGSRFRLFVAALVSMSFLVTTSHASQTVDSTTIQHVTYDADWLLQASASDGAIGTWIDQAWVVPYRSNFAAMGLARATALTGDQRFANAAWRWLAWDQAHMDSSGYITDYERSGSGWVSTGTDDSTDAYASTYLSAMKETLDATGDLTKLSTLRVGFYKALEALRSTQDWDGLHFAKPDWPFKYVMDDSENYAGLRAAAYIASVLGDSATQSQATSDANAIQKSFPKFWDAAQQGYDWGMHANGTKSLLDWTQIYPSASAQMWAIAFGVITGSQAQALFTRLDAAQPWDQPTATSNYPSGPGYVYYWPVGILAALRTGNIARAQQALANIRNGALAQNNYWPFTTAESGELIMAETDGLTTPAPLQPMQTSLKPVQTASAQSISAQLRETVSGTPIANAIVQFWAVDLLTKARKQQLCTVATNSQGSAVCSGASILVDTTPGGFEADYSGAAIYLPSTTRSTGI